MIAFVIPIKPKFNSKNWLKDNLLLTRTLRSVCNQTDMRFTVYVVYHDEPEIDFYHPNIKMVRFPFAYVIGDDIDDYESRVSKWHSKKYAEFMFDKGKKITYGCKKAIENGCTYIMAIDSDDLISNKISSYVNSSAGSVGGWVINKGYIYNDNSLILIKNHHIQGINGSTHIIHRDLITIPTFTKNDFFSFNFFEAHGYLKQRIKDTYNIELKEIPFFGIIYLLHNNNTSGVTSLFQSFSIKTIVKYLIYGVRVTNSIKNQFSLYNVNRYKS